MSAEENKAIVRRFYQLFDQGDLDGIEALLDPNFIERDAFIQQATMFAAAFTDSKFVLEDMVVENDKVCVRGNWSATHSAELNGIPATGKHITMGFMVINQFSNGKIVERWEQADMLGMMQQLGVIPSPQTD